MPRRTFFSSALIALLVFAAAPPARAAPASDRADWLREARYGVMVHYRHDWIMRGQRGQMTPENWNRLVDAFDVGDAGQIRSPASVPVWRRRGVLPAPRSPRALRALHPPPSP